MRTLLASAAAAALALYYHDTIAKQDLVKEIKAINSLSKLQAAFTSALGKMDPEHLAFIAGFVFMFVGGGFVISWLAAKRDAIPVVKSDLRPALPAGPVKKAKTTALSLPDRPGKIQCYSPSTMTFLGEIDISTPEDVKRTIERARVVQQQWARSTFAERRRVLKTMKAAILSQADSIVALSCLDTGKPRVDATFGEVLASVGKLDWVIGEGEKVLSPESRPSNFTSAHKKAAVHYAPLGVLGVIAPWNYPFYNLYNHIASGLMAGNAVVLKISEFSAFSGSIFIRLARDCLTACGWPADLVQLIQGFGETGAALVSTADKVIFTGSPGIGKAVMGGASKTLTPLVLELGGKDPFIVCEDADLDAALILALRGSFQNAGQNCVGIERVYCYDSIYDKFVSKAKEAVAKLRVGPPADINGETKTLEYREGVDVGCITTAPQLQLIQSLVEDAVSKGAKCLVGGKILYKGDLPSGNAVPAAAQAAPAASPAAVSRRGRNASPSPAAAASGKKQRSPSPAAKKSASSSSSSSSSSAAPLDSIYSPDCSQGLFYAPTLLVDVDHTMRIANEEVFGPVMTIIRVPDNSDEAAIKMANSTAYGLGATVYSSSPSRANKIAAGLRCGMVGVNAYGLNYLVQSLPFGGVGASGFDRFSGPEGLRACCITKSVVTDLFSFVSIPTPVPKPLQYPVAAEATAFTEGLMALQFAPSVWGKVKGILRLAGLPVKIDW